MCIPYALVEITGLWEFCTLGRGFLSQQAFFESLLYFYCNLFLHIFEMLNHHVPLPIWSSYWNMPIKKPKWFKYIPLTNGLVQKNVWHLLCSRENLNFALPTDCISDVTSLYLEAVTLVSFSMVCVHMAPQKNTVYPYHTWPLSDQKPLLKHQSNT